MAALVGLVLCAAPAQARGPDEGPFEYVSKGFEAVQGEEVRVTARCPGKTHVLSGGQTNDAPIFNSEALSSYPVDDGDRDAKPDDGWRAELYAYTSLSGEVRAVCTGERVTYAKAAFKAAPATRSSFGAVCPDVKDATAFGIKVPRGVQPDTAFPTGFSGSGSVDNVYAEKLKVKTITPCVGFETASSVDGVNVAPGNRGSVSNTCTADDYVIGGGVDTSAAYGESILVSTYPNESTGPPDSWNAVVDMSSFASGSRSALVHVVCVPAEDPF